MLQNVTAINIIKDYELYKHYIWENEENLQHAKEALFQHLDNEAGNLLKVLFNYGKLFKGHEFNLYNEDEKHNLIQFLLDLEVEDMIALLVRNHVLVRNLALQNALNDDPRFLKKLELIPQEDIKNIREKVTSEGV